MMFRLNGYRVVWTITAAFLVAAGMLLFVTPPRPVLRALVVASSEILLEGGDGVVEKLLRGYIQTSIAAHIAKRDLQAGGNDEEVLMRMMLHVRSAVLNPRDQVKLRYDPGQWSALIAGVGFCDQVNGAVAAVAAHRFPRAELVALYDPVGLTTPHTVGRVWSRERREWLYFDAFYATPVIFTKDRSGTPHVLRANPPAPSSPREEAPEGIYALYGWPLADFPRTFAMYLVSRMRQRSTVVVAGPAVTTRPAGDSSAAPAGRVMDEAGHDAPSPYQSAHDSAAPFALPADTANGRVTSDTRRDKRTLRQTRHDRGLLVAPPVLRPDVVAGSSPRVNTRDSSIIYRRIARAYVQARVEHLIGIPDRNAYRLVAADRRADEDDRAAEIAATAKRFLERTRL